MRVSGESNYQGKHGVIGCLCFVAACCNNKLQGQLLSARCMRTEGPLHFSFAHSLYPLPLLHHVWNPGMFGRIRLDNLDLCLMRAPAVSAKSRLFSTTGSHGSQGPEVCTLQPLLVHGGFFFKSDACHGSQGPEFCTPDAVLN